MMCEGSSSNALTLKLFVKETRKRFSFIIDVDKESLPLRVRKIQFDVMKEPQLVFDVTASRRTSVRLITNL